MNEAMYNSLINLKFNLKCIDYTPPEARFHTSAKDVMEFYNNLTRMYINIHIMFPVTVQHF